MTHTPADLQDLPRQMAEIRRARGESLAQFGATLAAILDRPAFTRQYISGMESGRMAVTPDIARALSVLAAMLDGVGELQAHAVPVHALAVHPGVEGAVIIPPPKPCALPGCQVRFVGYPAQRYCSPQCRRAAYKRKKIP